MLPKQSNNSRDPFLSLFPPLRNGFNFTFSLYPSFLALTMLIKFSIFPAKLLDDNQIICILFSQLDSQIYETRLYNFTALSPVASTACLLTGAQ